VILDIFNSLYEVTAITTDNEQTHFVLIHSYLLFQVALIITLFLIVL